MKRFIVPIIILIFALFGTLFAGTYSPWITYSRVNVKSDTLGAETIVCTTINAHEGIFDTIITLMLDADTIVSDSIDVDVVVFDDATGDSIDVCFSTFDTLEVYDEALFIDTVTGDILGSVTKNLVKIEQVIKPDSVPFVVYSKPFHINTVIDSQIGAETPYLFIDGITSEVYNYNPDTTYTINAGVFTARNRKGHTHTLKGLTVTSSNYGLTEIDTPTVDYLSGITITLSNGLGDGGGEVKSAMRPILMHITNYDSAYVAYGTDILFTFDSLSYTYRVWGQNIGFDEPIKGTIGSDITMLNINAPTFGPTGVINNDLCGILVGDMSGAAGENYSIKSLGDNYFETALINDSLIVDEELYVGDKFWFKNDTFFLSDGGADTNFVINNGSYVVIGGDNGVSVPNYLLATQLQLSSTGSMLLHYGNKVYLDYGKTLTNSFIMFGAETLIADSTSDIIKWTGDGGLELHNGVVLSNPHADTFTITEANTKLSGDLQIQGNDLTLGNKDSLCYICIEKAGGVIDTVWRMDTLCNTIIGDMSNSIGNAGSYSGIFAGKENSMSATPMVSFMGGGEDNFLMNDYNAMIGGQYSGCFGFWSVIAGGFKDTLTSYVKHSFMGGGQENYITGWSANTENHNAIVGGYKNYIKCQGSFIGGGYGNYIYMQCAGGSNGLNAIAGGNCDTIWGEGNPYYSQYNFIGAGVANKIYRSSCNAILGGTNNYITSMLSGSGAYTYSVILGGKYDSTYTKYSIAGGLNAVIKGATGDSCNTVFNAKIINSMRSFAVNCSLDNQDSTVGFGGKIWAMSPAGTSKVLPGNIETKNVTLNGNDSLAYICITKAGGVIDTVLEIDTTEANAKLSGDLQVQGNDITFGNGAIINNPHADTITITEANVKASGDLQVQGNDLTFGNGTVIDNPHADTFTVTEANTKLSGDLQIQGNDVTFGNGAIVKNQHADTFNIAEKVIELNPEDDGYVSMMGAMRYGIGYPLGADSIVVEGDTIASPPLGCTYIDTTGTDSLKVFMGSGWTDCGVE